MNHRVAKLKRKMDAKRRQRTFKQSPDQAKSKLRSDGRSIVEVKHDEEREDTLYSFDSARGLGAPTPYPQSEPFFRRDTFMMQLLASVCLFLFIAILMQTSSPMLERARDFIQTSFQEEFEFDRVAFWYEDMFGRPLALVPTQMETVAPGDLEEEMPNQYALPASGTIRESFQQNGRGIFVETEDDESVDAVHSGIVRYIGKDVENEWGKVVIIRHYDGNETWYGMLENIQVNLYDHVDHGERLAQVSPQNKEEDAFVGYYFALKEGEFFIDPIEVISVD